MKLLALCGQLGPAETSTTAALLSQFIATVEEQDASIETEIIYLNELNIPPSTTERNVGNGDDWPTVASSLEAADIVVFATPIWWANRSSFVQRAIERMSAFTDDFGFGPFKGKTAGFLIMGNDDGGQQVQGQLMEVMTYMGFTCPPFCGYYTVGNTWYETDERKQQQLTRLAQSLVEMAKKLTTEETKRSKRSAMPDAPLAPDANEPEVVKDEVKVIEEALDGKNLIGPGGVVVLDGSILTKLVSGDDSSPSAAS